MSARISAKTSMFSSSPSPSPRATSPRGMAAASADNTATGTAIDSVDERAGDEPVDWYGNSELHHAFASNEVDIAKVKAILGAHPGIAAQRNQFGRLPLHYALDRTRVHLCGLQLLLKSYPDGVAVGDLEGMTPYDVARRWRHSSTIRKLLLDLAPSLDRKAHLLLTYGPLANLAIWASSIAKAGPSPKAPAAYADEACDGGYVSGRDDSDYDEEEPPGGPADGSPMLVRPFDSSPSARQVSGSGGGSKRALQLEDVTHLK